MHLKSMNFKTIDMKTVELRNLLDTEKCGPSHACILMYIATALSLNCTFNKTPLSISLTCYMLALRSPDNLIYSG